MLFQSLQRWPRRVNSQETAVEKRFQFEPYRAHVSYELLGGFLIGEDKCLFAASASFDGEMCREAALSGSGRAGYQDAAAAEHPLAAEHLVKSSNTCPKAFLRSGVIEPERGYRHHREALFTNNERIFVRSMW